MGLILEVLCQMLQEENTDYQKPSRSQFLGAWFLWIVQYFSKFEKDDPQWNVKLWSWNKFENARKLLRDDKWQFCMWLNFCSSFPALIKELGCDDRRDLVWTSNFARRFPIIVPHLLPKFGPDPRSYPFTWYP